MKKTIYNLPALQEVLIAANQRYLKLISSMATLEVGVEKLYRLRLHDLIKKAGNRYKSDLIEPDHQIGRFWNVIIVAKVQ